ncbi:MAG TPA: DUF3047 domain-containing protein [Thermodesulfobacteriota bacterium]|nr:DUF3047 domain-containing protein [Thermodesulfobacteriota bacterium]
MRILPIILIVLLILGAGGVSLPQEKKEVLVVDRFAEGLNEEGLPKGWILQKGPNKESRISIEQDKQGSFLRLLSVNDTFGLEKKVSFDIRKYPYLSWRWRVLRLPREGDIRKRETDDEAGQVYVLFPRFPTMVNTQSVGYIWDSNAPQGSSGTSTAYSKMKYFVLQSGPGKPDQWTWETRNVYEDYKKLFNEEPPEVGGLLLFVNTQHTQSPAEMEYGEIFFSTQPPKDLKP